MTWVLYSQWRFRNIDPVVALRGRESAEDSPPWPSRLEAVMAAFAMHAAEAEGGASEFVRAFAEVSAGG